MQMRLLPVGPATASGAGKAHLHLGANSWVYISRPLPTLAVPNDIDWIVLAVGGTGFAPALQLARNWQHKCKLDSISRDSAAGLVPLKNSSAVRLICSSRSIVEARFYAGICDNLIKDADSCSVMCTHTVTGKMSEANSDPLFHQGRITADMLQDVIPRHGRGYIVVSGPLGFNDHVEKCIKRLGIADECFTVLDA